MAMFCIVSSLFVTQSSPQRAIILPQLSFHVLSFPYPQDSDVVSSFASVPWKFQLYINVIKFLLSSLCIKFQHMGRLDNSFAGCLAKEGVDMPSDLLAFTL